MKKKSKILKNRIEKVTSKKTIFILFLSSQLTLLAMLLFTFPRINSKLGGKAFDLRTFGYTTTEAYSLLNNLDKNIIDFYLFPQLFFLDILYPLLLSCFLSFLTYKLIKTLYYNWNYLFSIICLIPFLGMLFDYSENILISIMITNSTHLDPRIINVSSIATQLKSYSTIISWIIIILLVFQWLMKKYFLGSNDIKK